MFKMFSSKKASKKKERQAEKKKDAKSAKSSSRKRKSKTSPKRRRVRQGGPVTPQRKGAFDALFLYDLMLKECEKEVEPSAAVFLEGVLNYLGTEIVELSYNRAKERSKGGFCIIIPEDILTAVENDEELKYMIKFKKSSRMQIKMEPTDVQKFSDVDIA